MKDKLVNAIVRARALYRESRKAVVPAIAALGLIVGVDAPLYADIVAVAVALGVYRVPNATNRPS